MISSKRSIDRSISKTPFFFFFFFWFLVFGWALFLLLSSFDGERVFSFEDTFKEERALLLLFFLFLLRKRLSSDLPSKRVWSKECEKERKREREQRGRRRKNHTQSCLLWVKRIRFKEREREKAKKNVGEWYRGQTRLLDDVFISIVRRRKESEIATGAGDDGDGAE